MFTSIKRHLPAPRGSRVSALPLASFAPIHNQILFFSICCKSHNKNNYYAIWNNSTSHLLQLDQSLQGLSLAAGALWRHMSNMEDNQVSDFTFFFLSILFFPQLLCLTFTLILQAYLVLPSSYCKDRYMSLNGPSFPEQGKLHSPAEQLWLMLFYWNWKEPYWSQAYTGTTQTERGAHLLVL